MCTSTGSVSPRMFLVEVGSKDPLVTSRGAQAGLAAPDRELRGAATSAWMCYTWLLLQSTSPVPRTWRCLTQQSASSSVSRRRPSLLLILMGTATDEFRCVPCWCGCLGSAARHRTARRLSLLSSGPQLLDSGSTSKTAENPKP